MPRNRHMEHIQLASKKASKKKLELVTKQSHEKRAEMSIKGIDW